MTPIFLFFVASGLPGPVRQAGGGYIRPPIKDPVQELGSGRLKLLPLLCAICCSVSKVYQRLQMWSRFYLFLGVMCFITKGDFAEIMRVSRRWRCVSDSDMDWSVGGALMFTVDQILRLSCGVFLPSAFSCSSRSPPAWSTEVSEPSLDVSTTSTWRGLWIYRVVFLL